MGAPLSVLTCVMAKLKISVPLFWVGWRVGVADKSKCSSHFLVAICLPTPCSPTLAKANRR